LTTRSKAAGVDLALPPVELLGDQEPVGRVAFTEWKVVNPALRCPFALAAAKIALEATRRLITVFGPLREQLHDDRRNHAGNFLQPLGGGHRPPGQMAVHPFHRLRGNKGQSAGKHLVESDAECVEVAAGIDGPIHPTGLLGRHIGKRASNHLGRVR
jgi:hypothetical protein